MHKINFLNVLVLPLILLLTSCVTVTDGEIDLEQASRTNVILGEGYYQNGNLELANQKILKAIKQDPNSSKAYHAYAVLLNRYMDYEKAEFYFNKSISLDSANSEALNNYGVFLCLAKRLPEAEKMFLLAVENPSYRSPELAYTNAADCLLREGDVHQTKAKGYLKKALAMGTNYRRALILMADINLKEKNYDLAGLYLDRFHLTGDASAKSLWIKIQNELAMGNNDKVDELAEKLTNDYADSEEYKQWLALEK